MIKYIRLRRTWHGGWKTLGRPVNRWKVNILVDIKRRVINVRVGSIRVRIKIIGVPFIVRKKGNS